MPVVIGAKPQSNFADPIGLLTDCHRRIERFLSVLVDVSSQARGGPLSHEQRASWETALKYFREAAPKHTADEEDTLFPRLRGLGSAEMAEVLARVDSLEDDHTRADRGHAEVEGLGQKWLAEGSLSPLETERLSAILAELAELYQAHIAMEEREVFPAAAKLLSASERKTIGEEMAARRGLQA